MPTYIYSPVQSSSMNTSGKTPYAQSDSMNYSRNKGSPPKKQKTNLLSMYTQRQQSSSRSNSTLQYNTTAPTFVGKRYKPRSNGGYTLEYNLKNASIKYHSKPKLRFVQLARLISPNSLK
jgi:hypothetical protein